MIKLVILDFDDTLCLTEEICFHIENAVAVQMGFSQMTREAHQKNWGMPLQQAIVERVPGIDAKIFVQKLGVAMAEQVKNGIFDTVSDKNIQTLKTLKENGKQLAILTSRSYKEAVHLLDENNHLNSYIEKIYHADNSAYLKPDPRVFDQILADFAVSPTEAIYIGNSLSDATSAKEAGLHFIAVIESKLRTENDFTAVPVDYFAPAFEDILTYLDSLEK